MNQKDYKEIAGIIKGCHISGERNLVIDEMLIHLANRLADYFEREETIMVFKENKFNKQQFLKECGVEK